MDSFIKVVILYQCFILLCTDMVYKTFGVLYLDICVLILVARLGLHLVKPHYKFGRSPGWHWLGYVPPDVT